MGKAAKSKSKREEKAEVAAAETGDYQFNLPAFDEQKFIRREVQTAKVSFYTLALAVAAGIVSVVLYALPIPWAYGWAPIVLSMLVARPLLQRLGLPEDVTTWKALAGSFFMMFFTGLAVWILGVNVL